MRKLWAMGFVVACAGCIWGQTSDYSTVSGGLNNSATGFAATVSGGMYNEASGSGATVPGGEGNYASGANSLAAGFLAEATNDGAFVWSDMSDTNFFSSVTNNEFAIRAAGGLRLVDGRFIGDGSGVTNLNSEAVVSAIQDHSIGVDQLSTNVTAGLVTSSQRDDWDAGALLSEKITVTTNGSLQVLTNLTLEANVAAQGSSGEFQVNQGGKITGTSKLFIHEGTGKPAFYAENGNLFRVYKNGVVTGTNLIYSLREEDGETVLRMFKDGEQTVQIKGDGTVELTGQLVADGSQLTNLTTQSELAEFIGMITNGPLSQVSSNHVELLESLIGALSISSNAVDVATNLVLHGTFSGDGSGLVNLPTEAFDERYLLKGSGAFISESNLMLQARSDISILTEDGNASAGNLTINLGNAYGVACPVCSGSGGESIWVEDGYFESIWVDWHWEEVWIDTSYEEWTDCSYCAGTGRQPSSGIGGGVLVRLGDGNEVNGGFVITNGSLRVYDDVVSKRFVGDGSALTNLNFSSINGPFSITAPGFEEPAMVISGTANDYKFIRYTNSADGTVWDLSADRQVDQNTFTFWTSPNGSNNWKKVLRLGTNGVIYGNGSGITNLNVIAAIPAGSIESSQLSSNVVAASITQEQIDDWTRGAGLAEIIQGTNDAINVYKNLAVHGDVEAESISAAGSSGEFQVNQGGKITGTSKLFIHEETGKPAFYAENGNLFRVYDDGVISSNTLMYSLRDEGGQTVLRMFTNGVETIKISGDGTLLVSGKSIRDAAVLTNLLEHAELAQFVNSVTNNPLAQLSSDQAQVLSALSESFAVGGDVVNITTNLIIQGTITADGSELSNVAAGGNNGELQFNDNGMLAGNTNFFMHPTEHKLAFRSQSGNIFRAYNSEVISDENLIYSLRKEDGTSVLRLRKDGTDGVVISGDGSITLGGVSRSTWPSGTGDSTNVVTTTFTYVPPQGDLSMGIYTNGVH